MLVLLPLRLWAGTLMPMAFTDHVQAVASHVHEATPIQTTPLAHVAIGPHASGELQTESHEAIAIETVTSIHAVHALNADSDQNANNCSEGSGCIACSVCHLSAVEPGSLLRSVGNTEHTVADLVHVSWLGHAWPPLIKPPIF